MSARMLQAEDIRVFSDAAAAFFQATTGAQAQVRTAYLLQGQPGSVRDDFTGVIELGGRFQGQVCFSAPRGMLTHILLLLGEQDYSDASHRDIVGEIANQMTGQARRHYGEGLDIRPPRVLMREQASRSVSAGAPPFVIPLSWDRYEAQLLVAMQAT
jgi:chemotaxis protein CheX